jgi:diguanylate cyclase (GGDEF)-like protein/PAS domain S-box-containing protein
VRSLGIRLALIISTVLFLLMSVAGVWLDRQITKSMRAEEVRQAEVHGSTLLASLQTLMLNGQGTLARSWLDRMQGESGIIDIEILRRDGKEAFTDLNTVEEVNRYLGAPRFERQPVQPRHEGRVDSGAFRQALRGDIAVDWRTSGAMTLLMPIERRAECLACHGYDKSPLRGVLKLSLSTTYAEKRIALMRYRMWAVTVGLVAVLGLAMWLGLRSSVLRPIARLREAITRAGEGDRTTKLALTRRDELGEVAGVFNRMQEQLLSGEARIRAVMDNVVDAVITIDEQGVIESANKAVRHVFGYAPEELLGRHIKMLMPALFRDGNEQFIEAYLTSEKSRTSDVGREIVSRRKDGRIFPIDLAVSEMRLHGHRYFIGIARDITERKEQMAAMRYQALHDGLTDLPNRTLFSDRLHQGILSATREERSLALIIMDLDHFKEINDTLGHHSGDAVLQQVANRIRAVLRESDTVARLGGDEFALLLPSADLEDATHIAKKLLATLETPFELETRSFRVGASLGIGMFPVHGRDGTTLMKCADMAMYEAKRDKSGYAVYDSAKDQFSSRNLSLMGDLRDAIDVRQLALYYQPIVNLRTGRVSGAEALVRWRHPRHGLMYPGEFIPLAEQAGLIKAVTLWVLRQAVAQYGAWRRSGIYLDIVINISGYNLHDGSFAEGVAEILRGVDGERVQDIGFEITETAMMAEPSRALEMLHTLEGLGIYLSVDDFGTGYSSIPFLKQAAARVLKIDKSFVIGMSGNDANAVIVRSIIELAHNIGLQAVAEGVEDRQTYDILTAWGCDAAQGYYISQALDPEEFTRWLEQNSWGIPPSAGTSG